MADEKKCIEREALLKAFPVDNYYTQIIREFPAADVRTTEEVSKAVDEALRILNAIRNSGRFCYRDYCRLHDAISAIYGDETKESRLWND